MYDDYDLLLPASVERGDVVMIMIHRVFDGGVCLLPSALKVECCLLV